MAIIKVKVSQLPEAQSLEDLWVLGVDHENQSVKTSMPLLRGNTAFYEWQLKNPGKTYDDWIKLLQDPALKSAEVACEAAKKADETNTRVTTAEDKRVIAEQNRVTEEGKRVTAESGRTTAESARVVAEGSRVTAEQNRTTEESKRATAETARTTAEGKRVAAESLRVTAEQGRVAEEGKRVAAEAGRATAEGKRVTAEAGRVSTESARVTAEGKRVTAEQGRVTEEGKRVTAETARATAEGKRVTAETSRVGAEQGRVTEEGKRVTAEAARKTASETAVKNANTATTAANTATTNANAATKDAKEMNQNPPKIQSGTWWVYDLAIHKYVDTKQVSRGPEGKPLTILSNGNYAFWDDKTNTYKDSGIKAAATVDLQNVPVTFTQAGTRTTINTGETIPTILGKIKKWFADLGTLAWKSKVNYNTDIDNKPASLLDYHQKFSNQWQTITVTGDYNTFYPVAIRFLNGENRRLYRFGIGKILGTTSNANWAGNHTNKTSSMSVEWAFRSKGWDGNANSIFTLKNIQPYAPLLAKVELQGGSFDGIVVWLRGGTATYDLFSDNPIVSCIPYYSTTNIGTEASPYNVSSIPLTNLSGQNRGNYAKDAIPTFTSVKATTIDASSNITANGELRSTSANGVRIVQGNYGAILRNDGGSTFLLFTNSGDQYGNWNTLRPISVNNANASITLNGRIITDTLGRTFPASTSTRRSGMYGIYDSAKTGHIWSMGSAYMIADDGANFGNLYGLAYKHTNNATGGTMAGGHQMVWCDAGVPKAAMGYNGFWASTGYYKNGSSDSYVLLGGGGHKAVSDFATSTGYVKKTGDIITGDLKRTVNKSSNYVAPITWVYSDEQTKIVSEIGLHSTGGNAAYPGAMVLRPYHSATNAWNGTEGLIITKDTIQFENKPLLHSGNYTSYPPPKLATARTIWGQSFNGTGNVTGTWYYNGTSGTSSNTHMAGGSMELYHPTPFIDFHFGNSTADYTSRLIENASGRLSILSNTTPKLSIGLVNDSYNLAVGSMVCNSWVRTNGAAGWYSQSYGGGIYMTDANFVRIYNNKKFQIDSVDMDSLKLAGGITTSKANPGSWVSGMTSALIDLTGIQTQSSYHPYIRVKNHLGHVANLGGLGNQFGFYGYYNGRTTNGTDWHSYIDMSNGNWTHSKNLTAANLIKSGSSNNYVLLGGGGHKAASDFAPKLLHKTATLTAASWTGSGPYTYKITDSAVIDNSFVEIWPVAASRTAAKEADIYEDVTVAPGSITITASKKPTANINIKYKIQ